MVASRLQIVVAKSLNEDKMSMDVLKESTFLQKLLAPGSENMLLCAHIPQLIDPTGLKELRQPSLLAGTRNNLATAMTTITQQLQRQLKLAPGNHSNEAIDRVLKTQVTVLGLWPTLFVSLLGRQ